MALSSLCHGDSSLQHQLGWLLARLHSSIQHEQLSNDQGRSQNFSNSSAHFKDKKKNCTDKKKFVRIKKNLYDI